MIKLHWISICIVAQISEAFVSSRADSSLRQPVTALQVSELHVPGYAKSKLPFILKEEHMEETNADGTLTLRKIEEKTFDNLKDFHMMVPYEDGFLIHKTRKPLFSAEECQRIVDEAEDIASKISWSTDRHGNFPTTDLPLIELPETLKFLRFALVERIYPMLQKQFGVYLPDPTRLRLADGFVVKYDALGGQTELKPHRDGSVLCKYHNKKILFPILCLTKTLTHILFQMLAFNIALNPASEFEGGGTWFASFDDAVKIDQGEVVSHSSALLHGGHGITSGKRYILVGFVILEGYDSWSMRFYNEVRNK